MPHFSLSYSPEETFALGWKWGQNLPEGTILCFQGDLAAGKTTMIKGIVEGVSGICREEVQSPTFAYLHIYQGKKTVYHFDLYRMQGHESFLEMGLEEYFSAGGVCCIEWSERIDSLIPPHAWRILLEHEEGDRRRIYLDKGEGS